MMKKILIIEDDKDIRENIAEILDLSGYEVIEAKNGKVGVRLALISVPDLILCDIMMPELDGFGVLKILNGNPTLQHIPFLFLTAKTEKSDFRKGMGLGADDYITKPFDDTELLEAIEMRLKKSSLSNKTGPTADNLRTFYDESRANEDLLQLLEKREDRKYNKKDLIYEEGQFPKYLFHIKSGQVKTYQISEIGKELTLSIHGPGDFYGYLPILNSEAYKECALAQEITIVTLIPMEDFKSLLFKSRDFSSKFMSMLASYASHSDDQLIEIAYSSVRKKLANAILALVNKSTSTRFIATRDDLASLTGSAKETVTRALSDFKNEGLVIVNGSEIEVVDIKLLEMMPQ